MCDLIEAELRQAGRLKQKHLDSFARDGIPALSLAKTWDNTFAFVGHDWCVFDDDRFEFARHSKSGTAQHCFVFPAWDAYGDLADVVAWRPPKLALWFGAVAMLGEEQVNGPRIGEPLAVHPDVASWFRAKREGVFIIDHRRAADLLRSETLGVASAAHARALKSALTLSAPPIVVVEPMQAQALRLHEPELAA